MSNSSLVVYTKISPNKNSPRNHSIDTITIHCVVGQLSAESICGCFTYPSRQASCNYGIGFDGRVSMCVEEHDRSWCTSSYTNDNRAITIEVASDRTPPYTITDKAYRALIALCTDICKRNNIKELKWRGDKSLIGQVDKQNMSVHRWFANKECPGDYMYNLHGQIAKEVNSSLSGSVVLPDQKPVSILYRVQTGAFKNKENADMLAVKIKNAGFDTYVVYVSNLYKVQIGAYATRANADTQALKLKRAGFECFVTTYSDNSIPSIKNGSRVRIKQGSKTYSGGSITGFVFNNTYVVDELVGDRAVLDSKGICTPVNVKDLMLA